jgi:hypothetical protein
MAKKIVSVALAVLMLIIALFMVSYLAYDMLIRVAGMIDSIDMGDVFKRYHVYYQGHTLHLQSFDEDLRLNLYNNQSYLKSFTLCFIASTALGSANFVNDASVVIGFISLALILLSFAIPKIGNKISKVGKIVLIIAFVGIFASNLVIGFVDSAVWIRTLIDSITGKVLMSSLIIMLPRFNLWKVDNYVYALAALLGVAFVILSLKSNKTTASQNAKKEKKLAKLEKKQEKLKGQLENQEA